MVNSAQLELEKVQRDIADSSLSELLDSRERLAQNNLQQALLFQEHFWRDKARLKWFTQGDRNTAFFHKLAKYRHAAKQMSVLKTGDLIPD